MLILYTGLNGAGKTSSCLYDIDQVLRKTGRPFYASGINWTAAGRERFKPHEFDPEDWVNCPDGSVILIDEAQNALPARPNSKDLPEWINSLGTHRHRGLDIYFTTPHPMQIDVFARRLIQLHIHYKRNFGFGRVTRLENQGVMSDPTNRLESHKAIAKVHRLRKSVYPYYVSASMHTHKAQIPIGKLAMGLGFIGMLGVGGMGLRHVWGEMHAQGHMVFGQPVGGARADLAAAGRAGRPGGAGAVSAGVARGVGGGGAVGGGSGLAVVGSMTMGKRHVELVSDSKGNIYEAKDCQTVHDAPVCRLGGSVVTYPDVAPGPLVARSGG